MHDIDYLSELNEAQRNAVEYCDGPSLVIAGAGSGKTRVLVHKLIHLLNIGYEPYKLMALTFTNKAAKEMRERIYKKVGDKAKYIRMGTFHSVFARIIRDHAELIGYTSNYSIYDSNDSKTCLKSIIKEMRLDDKKYTANVVLRHISKAKNNLILPQVYINNREIREKNVKNGLDDIGLIYLKYFAYLRQSNALDFDDILLYTNILFRDYPEILKIWQDKIDYLLIDEYQDTNLAQYMIARKLVETKGKIFVVGDDAQSIYSFRGANIENILNFQNNFPTAKIFKLEQNYRSTKNIVNAANAVIKNNNSQHPKNIFSANNDGEKICIYRAETADLEANWLAQQISKINYKQNIPYDSFAVLYRNNSQSRVIEQAFRRNSLPFQIFGGLSFFSYKEVQDIMAYFRVLANEKDDGALLRIINYPKRGIGDTSIDKIRKVAAENNVSIIEVLRNPLLISQTNISKGTLSKISKFVDLIDEMQDKVSNTDSIGLYDTLTSVIDKSGIYYELMQDNSVEGKQRQENMQELMISVKDYIDTTLEEGETPSLEGYLADISLYTDMQTNKKDNSPSITLMTIHSAKGLEFPHIFIVGVEEKTFPSIMSMDSIKGIEEERRLMYVAITRAEKTCSISYARERMKYGRTESTRPSRFIREIPQHLISVSSDAVLHDISKGNRGIDSIPSRKEIKEYIKKISSSPSNILSKNKILVSTRTKNSPNPEKVNSIGGLSVGDVIHHQVFGEGKIVELEGKDADAKATIAFTTLGTKKLLLRFARLTKK